jgi:uncharacterized protein (TIGR01777 family)
MSLLHTLELAAKALSSIRPPGWQRHPIRAGRKAQPRTILVTGATGFIGRHLCRRLIVMGERVIVLTRHRRKATNLYGPHVEVVTSLAELENTRRIDAIVNLAGASIAGWPWTRRRRRELLDSRLRVTNDLVALIARLEHKPDVLISASAVGYYGVRADEEVTEADRGQPIFQSHLCQAWELAAQGAERHGTRVCRLRFGIVLDTDGGALPGLLRPARWRVALELGTGSQWISWIHVRDALELIEFCIEHDHIRGGVNATAPQPIRQAALAAELASRFGRFLSVTVPGGLLRACLGELSQLLISGQRVVPMKARCAGFTFRYDNVRSALDQLLRESRQAAEPVSIVYDSSCPVCDAQISRYCREARGIGLEWRADDAADRPELLGQYGLDTAAARKRVYVLDNEGHMASGMQAIVLMWSALPGWRVLARIARLPVISPVLDLGYDVVLAPLVSQWARSRRMRPRAVRARHSQ